MESLTTAGLICLGIGIALFLLEGVVNHKVFGQLIAVMRTTVLVIGVGMIVIGLIRGG